MSGCFFFAVPRPPSMGNNMAVIGTTRHEFPDCCVYIIRVPRRIKNSRYPNGYLEFLDWGTYFDRNPGRGFTSKRSFIIIEVSTDILGIVPVISVFFTPRISITGRDQRIRRGRRTPHSGHIVLWRVVKTHIGSA